MNETTGTHTLTRDIPLPSDARLLVVAGQSVALGEPLAAYRDTPPPSHIVPIRTAGVPLPASVLAEVVQVAPGDTVYRQDPLVSVPKKLAKYYQCAQRVVEAPVTGRVHSVDLRDGVIMIEAAEERQADEPRTINLARLTHEAPEMVMRHVACRVGDFVPAGASLLEQGFLREQRAEGHYYDVRARYAGYVAAIDPATACVTLTPEPPVTHVLAPFAGVVEKASTLAGVIRLRGEVKRLAGAFGFGRQVTGTVRVLAQEENPGLRRVHGCIVVVPYLHSMMLTALRQAGAVGVIARYADADALAGELGREVHPYLNDTQAMSITVLVLEGFAETPPRDTTLPANLATLDGQPACLDPLPAKRGFAPQGQVLLAMAE